MWHYCYIKTTQHSLNENKIMPQLSTVLIEGIVNKTDIIPSEIIGIDPEYQAELEKIIATFSPEKIAIGIDYLQSGPLLASLKQTVDLLCKNLDDLVLINMPWNIINLITSMINTNYLDESTLKCTTVIWNEGDSESKYFIMPKYKHHFVVNDLDDDGFEGEADIINGDTNDDNYFADPSEIKVEKPQLTIDIPTVEHHSPAEDSAILDAQYKELKAAFENYFFAEIASNNYLLTSLEADLPQKRPEITTLETLKSLFPLLKKVIKQYELQLQIFSNSLTSQLKSPTLSNSFNAMFKSPCADKSPSLHGKIDFVKARLEKAKEWRDCIEPVLIRLQQCSTELRKSQLLTKSIYTHSCPDIATHCSPAGFFSNEKMPEQQPALLRAQSEHRYGMASATT